MLKSLGKKYWMISLLAVTFLVAVISMISFLKNQTLKEEQAIARMLDNAKLPIVKKEPRYVYGFRVDDCTVEEKKVEKGVFFADMLAPFSVAFEDIYGLRDMAKPFFDTRQFVVNKPYTVAYKENGDTLDLKYLIYEKNAVDIVIFDFTGPRDTVYEKHKEMKIVRRAVAGIVNSSLFESMTESNLSPQTAVELAEIFASSIDFYRVHKGDYFKLVFEDKIVEGESVGVAKILAAQFNHNNQDYFGFRYEQDGKTTYFDEKGNSARKAFLKSPLKFGRLTSGYTMKRFHPVQKRFKAHLGTDYAAPKGTPISTIGDGVILEAKYSAFNGNYVKVKHSKEIVTQYLHMSRFASGIRPGRKVSQGETIGYVGSTGLSTGPHVCFRYWKNGKQVNHLKEKFATYTPVNKLNREKFDAMKGALMNELNELKIPQIKGMGEEATTSASIGFK